MASTETRKSRILGVICVLIMAVILIAGLWPFNFIPANKAELLQNGNGIRFYGQSMVVSRQPLDLGTIDPKTGSISIELFVRPNRESNDTVTSILTLYGHDRELFMIGQWRVHLAVRVASLLAGNNITYREEIGISNVLTKEVTHLLTLVSEKNATDIYIDGKLNEHFPIFSLVPDEFALSGRLLVGNSPDGEHSWHGTVFGIAIYDRILSDKEVRDHFNEWKILVQQAEVTTFSQEQNVGKYREDAKNAGKILNLPIALYRFDERSGTMIHDQSSSGNDLMIPKVFNPLRRTVLDMPSKDFFFSQSNLMDITVNVLGFIPFGFFLTAWLQQQTKNLRMSYIYGISLFLGFFLSLGIELTQAYLPTRDSSLLDVISNTVGTAVGMLCLRPSAKSIFRHVCKF